MHAPSGSRRRSVGVCCWSKYVPGSNRVRCMPSSVISSHSMRPAVLITGCYGVNNIHYVCYMDEAQVEHA